jgi:endoglycosylceramidase
VFGEHGVVGDYGTLPAGLTQPSDPDASLLSLGTSGSFLTNSDGQVVTLHGLNEVYKIAPGDPLASGFNDDDAAFLAENGFNAVRVGVIWSDLEPEPGVFDTTYLNSIESTVQTLGNHGIYSIIDFHQDAYSTAFGGEGAPDWAVQTDGVANPSLPFPYNEFFNPAEQQAWESFWSNADAPNGIGLENNYSQMLEYVANAFNGDPNVAGFELMNEPSPGVSSFLSTLFGNPFFDSQQLTPFYDQGADAIRAVDPSTPIFFEPNVLSNAGVPTDLGHVDATNTVLSFHDYCEFDLGPLGCIPSVGGIVGNAENYAEAQGIPAFLTEFGATSDQAEILAPMQGADQHLIGWTEWAYSGQGDITTSASPPGSESLVYNPADPLTGANINTANLDTLAEPYPQLVSGTPTSYSFDNGTFQFSYSTAEADGLGSFPAGSETTISVPSVEFPDGYHVSVTGGEVVSAPNAAELVIASNSGASTVTVTVSAAGT